MNVGGGQNKPDSSGYFSGRDHIPQAGVNKNEYAGVEKERSLLGTPKRSTGESAKLFFGKLVRYIAPKRFFKEERAEIQKILDDEQRTGKFKPLKSRRVERSQEHIRKVLDRAEADFLKTKDAPSYLKDKTSERDYEFEQRVYRGAAKPRSDDKRREIINRVAQQREEATARGVELGDNFRGVRRSDAELYTELNSQLAIHREDLEFHRTRLKNLKWYQREEPIAPDEADKAMTRSELKAKISALSRLVIETNNSIKELNKARVTRHDFEKESPAVVSVLTKAMEDWQTDVNELVEEATSSPNALQQRILRKPENIQETFEEAVKEKYSQLRLKEIPALEKEFLEARGLDPEERAQVEAKVSVQLHAMRLMAERLDTILRSSKDLGEFNRRVDMYLLGDTRSLGEKPVDAPEDLDELGEEALPDDVESSDNDPQSMLKLIQYRLLNESLTKDSRAALEKAEMQLKSALGLPMFDTEPKFSQASGQEGTVLRPDTDKRVDEEEDDILGDIKVEPEDIPPVKKALEEGDLNVLSLDHPDSPNMDDTEDQQKNT